MNSWDKNTRDLVWLMVCVAIVLWLFCKGKPK